MGNKIVLHSWIVLQHSTQHLKKVCMDMCSTDLCALTYQAGMEKTKPLSTGRKFSPGSLVRLLAWCPGVLTQMKETSVQKEPLRLDSQCRPCIHSSSTSRVATYHCFALFYMPGATYLDGSIFIDCYFLSFLGVKLS